MTAVSGGSGWPEAPRQNTTYSNRFETGSLKVAVQSERTS